MHVRHVHAKLRATSVSYEPVFIKRAHTYVTYIILYCTTRPDAAPLAASVGQNSVQTVYFNV